MILKTSSVAASVLLPLILALSFEGSLCSPHQNLNQQVLNRIHMLPNPQYQNSPQPPAPQVPPQLQHLHQQQPHKRPPINRVVQAQTNPPFAETAGGHNQQLRQPTPEGSRQAQPRHVQSFPGENNSVRQLSGQVESGRVPFADNRPYVNEQGEPKLNRDFKKQENQLDFAQRILGKLNSNDVRSMSLDGVNINNHQTTIKMNNKKNVNVNSFSHADAADGSRTKVDEMKMQMSGLEASNNGNPSTKKEKATPEQKELKRKLIELADLATSTPADSMRFNQGTQTFRAHDQADPSANLYRRKLLDAMRALSSKRLPTERLRKALEDDHEEGGSEFDVSDSSSQSDSESSSESGRDLDESVSASFSSDYVDHSNSYGEPNWPGQSVVGGENGSSEEAAYEQPRTSYQRDTYEEPSQDFYEQASRGFEEQPIDTPEESLVASSGYHAGSGHRASSAYSQGFQYAAPEGEEPGRVDSAESEPVAETVEVDHSEPMDETLDEVRDILGDRLSRLSDLLFFRPEILNQLLHIDDNQLTPIEREFKRMVLCNSDERFCNRDLNYCPVGPEEFSKIPPGDEFVNNNQPPYHNDQDEAQEPRERFIYETGPVESEVEYSEDFATAQAREAADEQSRNLLDRAARNLEGHSFVERQVSYDDNLHEGRSRANPLPFIQPQGFMESGGRGHEPSPNYEHSPSHRQSKSRASYAYQLAHESNIQAPQPTRNVPEPGPRMRSTWAEAEAVSGVPVFGDASRHATQHNVHHSESNQHHQAGASFRAPPSHPTNSQSGANHPANGPQQAHWPAGQNQPSDIGQGHRFQPQPALGMSHTGAPVQPHLVSGQQTQTRPQSARPDPRLQQQQYQQQPHQQPRGPQQAPSAGQQPVRSLPAQSPPHPASPSNNNLHSPAEANRAQSPSVAPVQTNPKPFEPMVHPVSGVAQRAPGLSGVHGFNTPRQVGPVSLSTNKKN